MNLGKWWLLDCTAGRLDAMLCIVRCIAAVFCHRHVMYTPHLRIADYVTIASVG